MTQWASEKLDIQKLVDRKLLRNYCIFAIIYDPDCSIFPTIDGSKRPLALKPMNTVYLKEIRQISPIIRPLRSKFVFFYDFLSFFFFLLVSKIGSSFGSKRKWREIFELSRADILLLWDSGCAIIFDSGKAREISILAS